MLNAFVSSIELKPSNDLIKLEIVLLGILFYALFLFMHTLSMIAMLILLFLAYKLDFFKHKSPTITHILFHGQRFYMIDSLGRKITCDDFRILFQTRFVLLCAYQKSGISLRKQIIFVDQLPENGLQQLYQACALQH